MQQTNTVTYISNAGVLLKLNDKKILIDGFCKSLSPIYKNIPPDISDQIISGVSPFDNIDLMLITHVHSDHFNLESINELLQRNLNTVVISTHEVISRIKGVIDDKEPPRLIDIDAELHQNKRILVNGISIQAISMIHDGKEYVDVSNLAYLINYGKTILHLGDAAPCKANYESLNLEQCQIDLLIANFPYVSLSLARKIVMKYINPRKIAIVHLPYQELDKFGWIEAAKRSYQRVKNEFIKTIFLEDFKYSTEI